MKKLLIVILQTIVYLVVFTVGSFARPLHVISILSHSPAGDGDRLFVWDGLVLMFVVYAVLLLVAALRKKFRSGIILATAALLLAAVTGFALRLGFITHQI